MLCVVVYHEWKGAEVIGLMGMLFGGMTVCGALRFCTLLPDTSRFTKIVYLIGGASGLALAAPWVFLGDVHGLVGVQIVAWLMPLSLIEVAFFAELRQRDYKLRSQPNDLGARGGQHIDWASHRFWSMVLLLSLRDKAREVTLEAKSGRSVLRYRIDGELHNMVPPPTGLLANLVDEIMAMAGWTLIIWRLQRSPRRLHVLSHFRSRHGIVRVRIGSTTLELGLTVQAVGQQEGVVVSIPDGVTAIAGQVAAALFVQLAQEPAIPSTGIQQVYQGNGNCALACVAMLGRVPYAEVDRVWRKMRLSTHKGLLRRITGTSWKMIQSQSLPRRLDRIPFPTWPVFVVIYHGWGIRCHAIVVKGEFVHDPNDQERRLMESYDKGHWRVARIYQPAEHCC
jgi:hypothetical protein